TTASDLPGAEGVWPSLHSARRVDGSGSQLREARNRRSPGRPVSGILGATDPGPPLSVAAVQDAQAASRLHYCLGRLGDQPLAATPVDGLDEGVGQVAG